MRLRVPVASTTNASVFGLARWQQVRIRSRGMHLDRKHFVYVEELQQQWQSAEVPGKLSRDLLRVLLQQLADGPSL